MPPVRRLLALGLAASLASGCTGVAAPSSSGGNGTPSASAAPSATPTATPAPTASPSPDPTPQPEPLVVEWTRGEPSGLPAVTGLSDLVATDTGLVLAGDIPLDDGYRGTLWHSPDGVAWEAVAETPLNGRVSALAADGPGVVAVGSVEGDPAVWLSPDGRAWERIEDASLVNGLAFSLVSTSSGFIAFGERGDAFSGALWTSADGREWLAATNETGLAVAADLSAVASWEGRAIAITKPDPDGPARLWQTTGRAEWTEIGELPDSADSTVSALAGGPRGWVAVGSGPEGDGARAWASQDGLAWRSVGSGPDVTSDVIADASGFIAVGFVGSTPGETCGDQRDFEMRTWTSADGSTWDLMPSGDFGLATVLQAAVVERTLVGLGVDFAAGDPSNGAGAAASWTAPLPEISVPAATSDEPSVPRSCGP